MKRLTTAIILGCALAFASLVDAQTLQTIGSFNGTNGAYPIGLTLGSDGNLYGTTQNGGNSDDGTVFRVRPDGTLTTLVSFNYTNGMNPAAALTLGSDGNFYGTTRQGGTGSPVFPFGMGTVFQVTTNGLLTTLLSFSGTDGALPTATLTLGGDGNFYGSTTYGGSGNHGTIFKVTTNGTLTTLANQGNTAALILGNDNNIYGTTAGSSGSIVTVGTFFKLTPDGTLTTLVNFNYTNGAYPSGLIVGSDGNFYGTTQQGGNLNLAYGNGWGTVFKVTPTGTLTTLVSFNYTNGANPKVALTLGSGGSLFGTTSYGGSGGSGTIFKLSSSNTLTTLASFNNTPSSGLTVGSDGNLYGTTYGGSGGVGTVFCLMLHSVSPIQPPSLALQFSAGCPLLNLNGMLSNNFVVQYSTNLNGTNWITLLSLSNLLHSPYQFSDPAGIVPPARFYRALMQ
jgi:uncharacterized repeat protein (TIGR03803 family)